jgi:hypothetical protein
MHATSWSSGSGKLSDHVQQVTQLFAHHLRTADLLAQRRFSDHAVQS